MRLEFRVNSGAWKISAVLTATPGWMTRNQRGGSGSGMQALTPALTPGARHRGRTAARPPPGQAEFGELVQLQAELPKGVERQQHRGCIRTAAAQAATAREYV